MSGEIVQEKSITQKRKWWQFQFAWFQTFFIFACYLYFSYINSMLFQNNKFFLLIGEVVLFFLIGIGLALSIKKAPYRELIFLTILTKILLTDYYSDIVWIFSFYFGIGLLGIFLGKYILKTIFYIDFYFWLKKKIAEKIPTQSKLLYTITYLASISTIVTIVLTNTPHCVEPYTLKIIIVFTLFFIMGFSSLITLNNIGVSSFLCVLAIFLFVGCFDKEVIYHNQFLSWQILFYPIVFACLGIGTKQKLISSKANKYIK